MPIDNDSSAVATDPSWLELIFPGVSAGRAVSQAIAVSVFAGLLWYSPVSPAALGHADALAGLGHAVDAVAAYDAIAAHHWSASVREEALFRSATVVATDLSDPDGARERYREVTRMPAARHAAQAWEAIGELQLANDRRPAAAARAFHKAWEADPTGPGAPDRLAAAARARAEAGQTAQAEALWVELATRHPERYAQAALERGMLALAAGAPRDALGLFEAAEGAAETPDLAAAARFGAATCLERMGDLDEALAAMDAADLPQGVRERRIEGIRARRSLSGM